ncbi:Calx-beta domain-containing protein [Rubritalea sp.]|uniref:Calx-beta domain-containing protein n=1 Tax=Rubritalea sp. TaxID=2109375 RepID=UPI003EF72A03
MKSIRILIPIVLVALGCYLSIKKRPESANSNTNSASQSSLTDDLTSKSENSISTTYSTAWKSASSAQKSELIKKAELRRDHFLQLMRSNPSKALQLSLSISEQSNLPKELQPYFEQTFNHTTELDLLWETTIDENGQRLCHHRNTITIDGQRIEAITTSKEPLSPLKQVPLSGIILADLAVLSPSAVTPVPAADLVAAKERYPLSSSVKIDPLTRNESSPEFSAIIGGEIHQFESQQNIAYVDSTLIEFRKAAEKTYKKSFESPFQWLAGNTGGDNGEGVAETPYQEDQIDVLFIRVDFSDFTGEPISKAALETTLSTVSSHIQNNSYGAADINYTVSNTHYRMPSTGASYAVADDNDGIQTDARALAAANYTIANYDVIAVYFPNLSGVSGSQITYGGLGSIGGANHWINGYNSVGIILHEFGHNYGLYHANYHHPEQELSGSYQQAGSLEYGDIFDEMGSGSSPEAHFSPLAKNYLDWLPDSKVETATTSGTFTIHRFDDSNALSNATLALKVPMDGDVNYWVGYRQLYTSASYNLSNAAYVVAENLASSRETSLIDMTPESTASETNDRRDAGLPVGGTYYDNTAGVRFDALENGGTDPNQWIKVQVTFDPRIQVTSTSLEVDEQQAIASITVSRSFNSSGQVQVDYATADGSATSSSDYYSVSGTLIWADGDSADKEIRIPIRPDTSNEGTEDFTLQLSGVIGGKLTTDAVTVSILDAGQRWTSFAPDFFNTTVNAITPLDNGKIIIGGNIGSGIGTSTAIRHIARLNSDGSVDSSFITGTGFNGVVEALTLQDDGKILVGGDFTSYNGTSCNRIARLNSDGTLDTSFATAVGSGANDTVRCMAVEANGSILVGGDFSTINGQIDGGLTRLLSSGVRDSGNSLNLPFDTGFGTSIYAILPESSGKIMVSGTFYVAWTGSGFRSGIARLNTNGSRDNSFDPDAGAHASGSTGSLRTVYSIKQLNNGKYLIAGSFDAYDETNVNKCALINDDGSIDSNFTAPSFNNTVQGIVIQASGSSVMGGRFTSPANRLERVITDGSVDATFNQGTGAGGPIYSIVEDSSGNLFIGGNFFSYNGISSRPIVKIVGGNSRYDLWVKANFTSSQIVSGVTDSSDDPDGDGIINLLEMAFSTDPNSYSQAMESYQTALHSANSEQYLEVSVDTQALSEGTWVLAQFSTDLVNWLPTTPTPTTNSVYEIIQNDSSGYTVRDKTPISANSARFGRIIFQTAE